MPDKVRGELYMLIGCLNDIAEKSKEQYTSSQIKKVQLRLEELFVPKSIEIPKPKK